MEDPQVRHRDMVVEVAHPRAGRIRVNGVPVKFSETPGEVAAPPPMLGEHTEAVARELGYDASEIAALRRDGVI
jgi:formyl-CoA transferase/CoA:oxalate CoA-transferase